jgi:hypothetical protein
MFQQTANLEAEGLRFVTTWTRHPDRLGLRIEAESTSVALDERPLRVVFGVPLDATGWSWGDDIVRSRPIAADSRYDNCFSTLGRKISNYPWSAVFDAQSGIALATPMDCPRIQSFAWDGTSGLHAAFDVCLTTYTVATGPRKAAAEFALYRFAPEWGFRAAAKRYYEAFPQFFQKRTTRDGCWEYPIPPIQIPNPQDFGFAFFEAFSHPAEVREACAQLGIGIFRYIEPWGIWQGYGTITEKPSYEARVDTLRSWVANTTSTAKWMGMPRSYTAQAVLNSSYMDGDDRFPIDAYSYYWHQWGGIANQLWMGSVRLDFTSVSLGSVYKSGVIDPSAPERQGLYIDSIAADGSMANLEDTNPGHFVGVRSPLCFSLATGKAVLPAPLDHYDSLAWISDYEHAAGRLMMGNTFPTAYRYYAHLLDITGSEVSDVRESSPTAALRRTLAWRKPNTNLLQWFRGADFVDHEEVGQYIKDQMFWGFFPGIASCGGGIGWGETIERYFLHPELYERDRPLFRLYIPVIRELSEAGWEPVTHARPGDSRLQVERFGEWSGRKLLFTVRNDSSAAVAGVLTLDAEAMGIRDSDTSALRCVRVPGDEPVAVETGQNPPTVRIPVSVSAADVQAYRLSAPTTAASPAWERLAK